MNETVSRKLEKLDLFGRHYIHANSAPKLEPGGKVSYKPGSRTYLVTTCHRGMKSSRYPEGYPLTYLGMFPAADTHFEVWLEDLWFQD